MENKENNLQPESDLTEEAQLDLLLEKFLAEDMEDIGEDAQVPAAEDAVAENQPIHEPEQTDPEEEPPLPQLDGEESTPETAEDVQDAEDGLVNEETPLTQEQLWEDQPVDAPVLSEEIGPDEIAVAVAGLTHPEDLEFEKIMEETLREAALEDAAQEQKPEEEDFSLPDEYFLPAEQAEDDQPKPEAEPDYSEVDLTAVVLQQAGPEADASEEAALQESAAEADAELEISEETEEEESEEEAEEEPPARKRRPKNTRTYGFFGIPHMVITAIWLAIILFIGASVGKMVWEVAADMLAFGRPNQVITITITSNDDLDDIAQKLHDTGLIKYPGIFKFYGNLTNAEKKVKPGTYELNTIFDYMALVKNMSGTAVRVDTKVVIPEGYTCKQIFRLLEKSGVCTVEDMEEAVMNADLSRYWFLEGIDQSDPNCLEGYLFPDTYRFYLDHDPDAVLTRLLDTFEMRFTEAMMEKLDALNETLADMMRSHGLSESYIQSNLFTVRELVIVASMIEKETSGDEESYYISSVIYNRLTNPGEYPYLNIDATLVYITGNSSLTQEDLKIDSPYNTYLYKGLIPGPISNPGLASLNAALSPENTEYYYYALDPVAGEHKFFKTYKAHQAFLESLKKGD